MSRLVLLIVLVRLSLTGYSAPLFRNDKLRVESIVFREALAVLPSDMIGYGHGYLWGIHFNKAVAKGSVIHVLAFAEEQKRMEIDFNRFPVEWYKFVSLKVPERFSCSKTIGSDSNAAMLSVSSAFLVTHKGLQNKKRYMVEVFVDGKKIYRGRIKYHCEICPIEIN